MRRSRSSSSGQAYPVLEKKLRIILGKKKKPLAVRSSGLFEDSLMQPFAGIFETFLVPNSNEDIEIRLRSLPMQLTGFTHQYIQNARVTSMPSITDRGGEDGSNSPEVLGEQYESFIILIQRGKPVIQLLPVRSYAAGRRVCSDSRGPWHLVVEGKRLSGLHRSTRILKTIHPRTST
jgi:hypothetical protein